MKILSDHLLHFLSYRQCVASLELDQTFQEGIYIDASIYERAWIEALSQTNDPNLGLNFGTYLNLAALESVYRVSIAASALRQVFQLWDEYTAANFPLIHFQIIENDQSFVYEVDSCISNPALKSQVLDAYFTFIEREFNLMLTDETQIRIEVPSQNLAGYKKNYRYRVKGGNTYRFIFDGPVDSIGINPNSRDDFLSTLPVFLQAVSQLDPFQEGLAGKVRLTMLKMAKPDFPTAEEVAAQFAMTSRTMQRKLASKGTSYREILMLIKKEIYTYMTLGKQYKKQDVAYFLGYSGTSALLHAVEGW